MSDSQMVLNFKSRIRTVFALIRKGLAIVFKVLFFLIKLYLLMYVATEIVMPFLFDAVNTGKLFTVGIAAFTPLAIFLTFSSLMYNRTRTIVSKSHQFRSLYIAERLFSAAISYLLALLAVFFCYLIADKYNFVFSLNGTLGQNYHSLLLTIPFLFFITSCFDLYFAISAIKFEISGKLPKYFARKVKKLL